MITELINRSGGDCYETAHLCDTTAEENRLSSSYNHVEWELTKEQIEQIISGKILVLHDGEYSQSVKLSKGE